MMLLLFWGSLALLVYGVAGYPLALAMRRSRPHRRQSITPRVSVVISVHNEIVNIERKIENLLQLEYPEEELEILIGSDGSTDGTVGRLCALSNPNIRVTIVEQRRGKAAMLNLLVSQARGEIVVLADARQVFDPQLLRILVQPFADPQVGAVSGELILTPDLQSTNVGDGVGGYWRYEKFIRSNESRIDSTIGATGAVYAIRRSLFEPIPEDTLIDDVLIPMRVARRGFRVLFEPGARAYDVVSSNAQQELTRKVRTLAGNFQLFARERWVFNPLQNRLCWQTVSHKVLRLLFPLLQAMLVAANLALATSSIFFTIALVGQLAFYACAFAGSMSKRRLAFLTFPFTFCLLSWATILGFLRYARGNQAVTWDRTAATMRSDVRPSHSSGTA